MSTTTIVYALGALILGFVGLVTGDFAMQWQPVPEWVPIRAALAYMSAAILLVGGVLALLPTRASVKAAACLGAFYGLWAVLLHLPRALRAPLDVGAWNGVAELTALAMGGIASLALIDAAYSRAAWSTRVFGACLLVFGTAHFVYDDFSATMIPAWLPAPLFWVYLTGCGHIAAGVSLISGIATRLASLLLTGMFACFVLLLHLPRVIAAPASRIEWIMLGISSAMTGAAWIVRCVVNVDRSRIRESVTQPA